MDAKEAVAVSGVATSAAKPVRSPTRVCATRGAYRAIQSTFVTTTPTISKATVPRPLPSRVVGPQQCDLRLARDTTERIVVDGFGNWQAKGRSKAVRAHEYKFLKIRGLRQFIGGSPDARPDPPGRLRSPCQMTVAAYLYCETICQVSRPRRRPEIAELARLRCAKRSMTRGHCEVRGGNTHSREAEFPGARFC